MRGIGDPSRTERKIKVYRCPHLGPRYGEMTRRAAAKRTQIGDSESSRVVGSRLGRCGGDSGSYIPVDGG